MGAADEEPGYKLAYRANPPSFVMYQVWLLPLGPSGGTRVVISNSTDPSASFLPACRYAKVPHRKYVAK